MELNYIEILEAFNKALKYLEDRHKDSNFRIELALLYKTDNYAFKPYEIIFPLIKDNEISHYFKDNFHYMVIINDKYYNANYSNKNILHKIKVRKLKTYILLR